ncbi:MAG: DNA repair protein RecO [Desulfovibrio sp.]|uniref:DNA repair protein RecO n=1 Tax=Desulfovibrio sp. 7SRBS1 TaxID=3378064 RepID=UPI003B3F96CB
MEFTEDVCIFKVGLFKENDLWVRYLSPTKGVLTSFAFGGAVSRKRFSGCLDALNIVRVHVKSSKEGRYLQLNEGTLLHRHGDIARDLKRLGMAVNCIQFTEYVQAGPDNASAAYSLLVESLAVLEAEEIPPEGFPLFYRAKMAFEQGYMPELNTCHVCGQEIHQKTPSHFKIDQGIVSCCQCGMKGGLTLSVCGQAVDALRFLAISRPGDWKGLTLAPAAKSDVFRLIDGFLEYHLGRGRTAGCF